jgi:hypothetical protein
MRVLLELSLDQRRDGENFFPRNDPNRSVWLDNNDIGGTYGIGYFTLTNYHLNYFQKNDNG